ncbi:uncharacterized protein LOC119838649 [Zerene cesonia]|uniref:uncharacterized protein LOC119838649 n=1 Tax=Zerene cesonia TaxID=33412 RepID=UPI0018E5893B|nr:uncharacterized protein LOC119838649 [Zerene cesonia]
MNMFPSLLDSVPKTRSQFVNDLEIPEIPVTPYIWTPEVTPRLSLSSLSEEDVRTESSASSLALSRAMTDSEIDYERFRRFQKRSLSDPWLELRKALNSFPPGYLDSLNNFSCQVSESESVERVTSVGKPSYHEELRLKMERFFDQECPVFSPDDPGYIALQEALADSELKDSDLESSLS